MKSTNDELCELSLLEQIEVDPNVNQSALATQLDMAVGTVNWYLKHLIAKGAFKVSRAERKKFRYIITPKGLTPRYAHALCGLCGALIFRVPPHP